MLIILRLVLCGEEPSTLYFRGRSTPTFFTHAFDALLHEARLLQHRGSTGAGAQRRGEGRHPAPPVAPCFTRTGAGSGPSSTLAFPGAWLTHCLSLLPILLPCPRQDILKTTKATESDVKLFELDLASRDSIHKFVAIWNAAGIDRIDGLVLNAGVMLSVREVWSRCPQADVAGTFKMLHLGGGGDQHDSRGILVLEFDGRFLPHKSFDVYLGDSHTTPTRCKTAFPGLLRAARRLKTLPGPGGLCGRDFPKSH